MLLTSLVPGSPLVSRARYILGDVEGNLITDAASWRLTAYETGVWTGVNNAWEQEKLEARKMLVNRATPTHQVHALLGALC